MLFKISQQRIWAAQKGTGILFLSCNWSLTARMNLEMEAILMKQKKTCAEFPSVARHIQMILAASICTACFACKQRLIPNRGNNSLLSPPNPRMPSPGRDLYLCVISHAISLETSAKSHRKCLIPATPPHLSIPFIQ